MPAPLLIEDLLFYFSRPGFGGEHNLQIPVPDENAWEKLLPLAVQNGVAGFIYRNTKNLNALTDHVRTGLSEIYRHTTFRNLDQLGETVNILKTLAANGITAIPLKGVVASEMIFDDLGVYPSSDIDILVRPEDLDAAKQVLQERAGYTAVPGRSEEDLQGAHYHYILHKKQYLLELHWNLTKRYFEVERNSGGRGAGSLSGGAWRSWSLLRKSTSCMPCSGCLTIVFFHSVFWC